MAVVGFEVTNREPYANGENFGESGSYDRVDGIVHYAVDPKHERNCHIIDLDLAPRDDQGLVRFYGDVVLLMPSDPSRGNRRLFMEAPNRGGNHLISRYIHRSRTKASSPREILAGDGFLLRHGFTLGWVGWQWDVYRSRGLLGLVAPEAEGVRGTTRIRFQVIEPHNTHLLAHRIHQPLPAADVEETGATLSVRDWPQGEPRLIPREDWCFGREEAGTVVPDPEHVHYPSGFELGKIYEVIYTTERAPIAGAGLLALRDLASYLRFGEEERPSGIGDIDRAYCFGVSQTGRMLRHFVYLGMNLDEMDRQVFDGLISHVAGARRGEFNHRFAQPSARDWPNFGHHFPFADEPMADPDTGVIDGMLKRQRELGGVPKIFWTNTSSEYWRGDSHLLHIDPTARYDLDPAPETRIYSLPSTQHSGGYVPVVFANSYGEIARYPQNVVDYTPFMRSLVLSLDRWASDGLEPPPSYHPRLSDGSAISYEEAYAKFPDIPGLYRPALERLRKLYRVDLGSEAERGIASHPPKIGDPYPALVWDVDGNGNEVSPVRPPDLDHPVGSHTGWNPRDPDTGAEEQAILFLGSTFFFPRTEAERVASGDPRQSIEERYASREDYLMRIREATAELVASGYILAEDTELLVQDAADRYDEAMKQLNTLSSG